MLFILQHIYSLRFTDVLQKLSQVNYQYVDISFTNGIHGKRDTRSKEESFRNGSLENSNSIFKKKYVEANQAFSELINLLDRHDEFMIDVNKTCTLVPLSKPLLCYF